ncbi:endo-1,4-beta-xylanase [Microlunatus flavus]|nr:endo-1,4-beta-xylanase [Microlunatus flavus]
MTTKSIGIADAANATDAVEAAAPAVSRRLLLGGAAAGGLALAIGTGATATAAPVQPAPSTLAATARTRHYAARTPLWKIGADARLAYGTSHTSRLFDDAEYSALVDQQAAILFTEDDLLWYQLKPTPDSALDFSFGDKLYARAQRDHQLVFAAHLVWDEGFGDGWGEDFSTLYELSHDDASDLLFGVEKALVKRYRGRTAGWIVANEVTDPEGEDGLRTEVPWYQTIGRGYVAKAFRLAKKYDRHAVRVINEFGFESTNEYGDDPEARQQAMLTVLKKLRRDDVPVDALGIQAHLNAKYFLSDFDPKSYRRFLNKVADLGVDILITEMDVLDDGLPVDVTARDAAVAECYARYLENVLPNRDVKALMTFGLSDRYTWLQEDYPREDGAERRPLPYADEGLKPKLAYEALRHALADAPRRRPLWRLPRHR